jgi:hypothetical protein
MRHQAHRRGEQALYRISGELIGESESLAKIAMANKTNLYMADLCRADLAMANLARADLSSANLSSANLSSANLYRADLSSADLSSADLSSADLGMADLRGASLRRADLSETNLFDANLYGANLYGANLYGATLPAFQLPQGDLVVWGKKNRALVEMLVPWRARRTACLINRKCRAELGITRSIDGDRTVGRSITVTNEWGTTIYKVGQETWAHAYDDDIRIDCAPGLHFFIDRREAEAW